MEHEITPPQTGTEEEAAPQAEPTPRERIMAALERNSQLLDDMIAAGVAAYERAQEMDPGK